MKILILSPHSDDAVFSCFDHIRSWIRSGHDVTVCTIFSKFTPSNPIQDIRAYMKESGFTDPRLFEKARQDEDRNALRYLGAQLITLDLVDGAFYKKKGKSIYPTFKKLFSGRIVADDDRIVLLKNYLKKVRRSYDLIVSPIGIGSQADHVITWQCAQNTIAYKKLGYYYDVPYYFFGRNWARRFLTALVKRKLSIRWITQDKIKCMYYYHSQIRLIIRNNRTIFFREDLLFFPELVIAPW